MAARRGYNGAWRVLLGGLRKAANVFRGTKSMSDITPIGLDGRPYNWRLLGILVVAMFVSTILVTPYALAIQADALKNIQLPLPLALLIPIQLVASTLFCGILAAIGLAVARRIGLGLPFLEGWLARKPDWAFLRSFAWRAVLAGVLLAVAVPTIQRVVFDPRLSPEFKQKLPHGAVPL